MKMSLFNLNIRTKRIKSGYPVLFGDASDSYFHPKKLFKKKIIYAETPATEVFFIDKKRKLCYYGPCYNNDYGSKDERYETIPNSLDLPERIIKAQGNQAGTKFGFEVCQNAVFLSNTGNLYGLGHYNLFKRMNVNVDDDILIPVKIPLEYKN